MFYRFFFNDKIIMVFRLSNTPYVVCGICKPLEEHRNPGFNTSHKDLQTLAFICELALQVGSPLSKKVFTSDLCVLYSFLRNDRPVRANNY